MFEAKNRLVFILAAMLVNSCGARNDELPPRLDPTSRHRATDPIQGPAAYVRIVGPRLIKRIRATVPGEARKARISALVVLEVEIDKRGNVSVLRVVRGDPLVNDSAVRAVNQWKYEPAVLSGEPIRLVSTAVVQFIDGRSQ